MIAGFDLSANPFSPCPSYMEIADLRLADRVDKLRDPEMRARILTEDPIDPVNPLIALARAFEYTYVLEDPVNYEPDPKMSVAARATRFGVSRKELAYDLLLDDDGKAMLYVVLANFGDGSLDFILEMMNFAGAVVGLGDGGAHYGMICDASYPTFMLTHWVRDRAGEGMSLEQVVCSLTAQPAALMGLNDRGRLEIGLKADVNVIDLGALRLYRPTVCYDLPSGGRRLDQRARGYRRTIVSGETTLSDDRSTGSLPGRLVRGKKAGVRKTVGKNCLGRVAAPAAHGTTVFIRSMCSSEGMLS